jgi:hypothetical protein
MLIQRIIVIFALFLGISLSGNSQEDTASSQIIEGEIQKTMSHEDLYALHSPKKATLLSVFLPGAGQIYNKKYWKAPIVWAGIGTALYLSQDYRKEYQFWRDQYIRRLDTSLTDDYPNASDASLQDIKDTYRLQMETAYIVAGAIYILQILDANVDAQLMTFDVSDDLSLQMEPYAYPNQLNQAVMGLTLRLNFKNKYGIR